MGLKSLIDNFNIQDVYVKKGYTFFEKDDKNYNINICGVRSSDMTPNTFNDYMVLLWKFNGVWNTKIYPCTTDPGLYYLLHPINVNGTAIMVPGQYKGCYKVGMHKDYEALQQIKPMKYYRDRDKDGQFDMDPKSIVEEIGMTNIHHAGEHSTIVERWSAGCQVLANLKDFNEFLDICKKSRDEFGNSFTYTLIEEKDITRV